MTEKINPLSAVGSSYKDFVITKYLPLEELKSALIELVHTPTGARVIHIANDDQENLFCLSFQTIPTSSNGVAHILEHTVLCGSKKFPVKDPFFSMTRRSLNTYMNALTGQDFTCYPASSQVEKDFYNLLDVYLDAVFHPLLRKESFLQEGHRLELVDPKNLESKLQFQGIVYNEMKGAMSSIESRLWEVLSKHLTPDLTYANNSGGNPTDIPSLSYEELLEFHKEFYHPSRCLFFFYGNLPLTKHLDRIEKELTQKIAPIAPLPKQKRFSSPVRLVDSYPIGENEPLEKKTQIAFCWLTAPISNQKDILALSLLESILADTDASPLPLALINANLATEVDSSLDVEMSEVPWAIVCKGCDEKDADKIEKLLFKTLIDLKITQEEIDASLHQLEFHRTEIGAEGCPFGLTLFMRAALIKQHGSDPENALLIHSLFDELREHLKDPNYLKKLLHKYLLDNPHFVRVTFNPDPKLEKKEQEEEQKRLQIIEKNLSLEDKKKIVEEQKSLKAYQEEMETHSLECLPKVSLKDVPPHCRDFSLIEKGNVFHHSCFTNQILYADLVFDLPEMTKEELPLLSLFSKLLPELGVGKRDYAETLAFQQSYIGGFEALISLHVVHDNPNLCNPTFSLKAKALYRHAKELFSLFSDVLSSIDFKDKKRINEWLSQHAVYLQNRLTKASMNYAVQTSLSHQSIPSFVYNQMNGIPYYKAVLSWAKNCDNAFIEKLKSLSDRVLGLENNRLVITCDENEYKKLEANHFYRFKNPNKKSKPWKNDFSLPPSKSQARLIAAPVAFTSLGLKTISYTSQDAPLLLIATELMENLILHKEIREKGGAYGSGATYTPSTGNFHFYAYRDPHLAQSVEAFQKAVDAISTKAFTEQQLEEAKLGVIQSLDSPIPPANRAMVAYSWKRSHRTYERREAFRNEILNASPEKVARAVKEHVDLKKGTLVSFLGKDLFEKENPKLKAPLALS